MREHNITPNTLDKCKDTELTSFNPVSDEALTDNINSSIQPEDILVEAEKLTNSKDELVGSSNLRLVLETRKKLKEKKATEIKFSKPVLKHGENAVIFPHTINVIQGQAGVHKSRLAENICSAFLKLNGNQNNLLGFTRTNFEADHTVVYVDTERNLSEQLPYALQSIQMKAGYNRADHPSNFEYISLLQIGRKGRYETLNEYLKHLKKKTDNPLFIVLDVSTDCIEDFNKTDKSMELIDLMNVAINDLNVIFLCLIHENPKSDKARGHFGTELMNKASTVMQVAFEKDANQNDSNIIRVKYLKCRSTARHTPFYITYSNAEKGLVLAEESQIKGVMNSRKRKATNVEAVELITMYLGDGSTMTRNELLGKLCDDFNASQRTIETRIKDIIDSGTEIPNNKGVIFKLSKQAIDKKIYYKLIPHESK
ncbi:MAG: hypothetical protein ACI9JN_002479 [Bacteroidia bacterium]|jgi:hypothetical protein